MVTLSFEPKKQVVDSERQSRLNTENRQQKLKYPFGYTLGNKKIIKHVTEVVVRKCFPL